MIGEKTDELRTEVIPKVTSVTTCLQRGGISHNTFKHKSLSKKNGGKEGELAIDQYRPSFRKHFSPPSLWKKT